MDANSICVVSFRYRRFVLSMANPAMLTLLEFQNAYAVVRAAWLRALESSSDELAKYRPLEHKITNGQST